MITVILKDGTEVPINDPSLPAMVSPHGVHDKVVAIFRIDTKEWTLGFLTSLRVGDAFRYLNKPEKDEEVFVVTKKPRIHNHTSSNYWGSIRHKDPDIYLEGVSMSTISALPPASQSRILYTITGKQVLTAPNRLLAIA